MKTLLCLLLLASGTWVPAQTLHSTLLKSEIVYLEKDQSYEVKTPDPRSDQVVYVAALEGVILAGYITLLPGEVYSPDRDIFISISRFDGQGLFISQESATALVQYYRDTVDETKR